MFAKKKKKIAPIKLENEKRMSDFEMKQAMGSGNSQVRYIPDEFIQSRILGGSRKP